jgi:hypothetical protein
MFSNYYPFVAHHQTLPQPSANAGPQPVAGASR